MIRVKELSVENIGIELYDQFVQKVSGKSSHRRLSHLSEKELIEVYQQSSGRKKDKALTVLYERYDRLLYGFIHQQVDHQGEDAEDICSTIWVIALEKLQDFECPSESKSDQPFLAWLRECARRRIKECHRKRQNHRDTFSPYSVEDVSDFIIAKLDGEEQQNVGVRSADFEADAHQLLGKAIASMAKREQRILQLKYWKGFPDKQIASELGLTYGATRTAISRAKTKVKQLVKDSQEGKGHK